ncbi:hypothetical protein [Bifidobacterium samirii]|uniref:LanR1 protein n=1 Tax=Bifidobacterium samirii TaxID=2306974 RepID=A0A430FVK5_9BIFI|nr:hypothetical protein [Bifidobacterium samirii]RSX57823.1 LanR1 protein [Bifidobacterium samirii]
MVLAVLITAVFVEMIAGGSGMLDPFTWAVYFGPYFICSSCSVMVSILYQDFRDGLFDLYMQPGRSYWSWCRLKCVFPVILDDRHVVKDMALAECDDYEAFTKAATLGRERTHVDFGIPR